MTRILKKWLHVSWKYQSNEVAQKLIFWTFYFDSKRIKSHGSAKVMNTTIPKDLYLKHHSTVCISPY